MSGRNLTVLIVLLLAVFVASQSLYVIKETERGELLRERAEENRDGSQGRHGRWPLANTVRKVDGRVLTVDSSAERFFTQEQKALIVDSYAKFRVDDSSKFYRATGFDEGRVRSLLAQRINDGLRNQVAIRTIQEVVSGERDELMDILTEQVAITAEEELGVELIDVRVKRIDLPREVSESVYRRMNAEREKEARPLVFLDSGPPGPTRWRGLVASSTRHPRRRGPELVPGHVISAPAIIEESFSTIVVYPGWQACVDDAGDYVLLRTVSAPSWPGRGGLHRCSRSTAGGSTAPGRALGSFQK